VRTLRSPAEVPVLTQRLLPGWGTVGLEGLASGLYFWEVVDDGLPDRQGKTQQGSGKLVVE
jgi:hypothetical protein